jgi:hypothetical protein
MSYTGDHPEGYKELRNLTRQPIEEDRKARLLVQVRQAMCLHEFDNGVCLICEAEDEDYEPSDAQIPGTYEIRKAVAA